MSESTSSRRAASPSAELRRRREIGFEDDQGAHDAVLIATGVYKSRDLGGPGAGLPGSCGRSTT
jgi:hypothetical protein